MTAVTAGFVVYHFMSNLTERMKTAFPTQPLQLEAAYANETCITLYVRSFASVNVRIIEAYVDSKPCDLTGSIDIWPDAIGVVHLYGFPLTFNVKYS